MQYSKPMIELVYEIRRRVNADLKPSIKLSNPELLNELTDIYHSIDCAVSKALIKELFALAGDPWVELLENNEKNTTRQAAKVYRGQMSLEESGGSTAEDDDKKKPVRIYRGRVIE